MPKGKAKAQNPDLYPDEDDAVERLRKSAMPQAAPHRRGGTHRVKDRDRTNTHWDDKNYKELITAVKERNLWVKDMPKRKMAHALARKDREEALAAKRANTEAYQRRKQLEEKKQREAEKLLKEKEERHRLRERRRMLGEDVSSSSEDDKSADDHVGLGHVVSDDDHYESTATTTTAPSSLSPIAPALKLRIFEWPYPVPPADSPPVSPISLSGCEPVSESEDELPPDPLPRKLPYAIMNVVTTKSRETLELPGRNMPEEVGPDFVPKLSEHTRDCARNGVILEPLGNAIIERGTDWAARTQVQWWNGRMYFQLPRRKTKADLADVYEKWKKNKSGKARQSHKKGGGITKAESKQKAQARLKERGEKMLDIYSASKYRPPICYVPSYLDFPLLDDDEEVDKSPYNLFYIRFRNMQLPHYFFWADPEEWEDPTKPNSAWVDTEANRIMQPMKPNVPMHHRRAAKVMVKREPIPYKFSPSAAPPKGSKYKQALWSIERDLYLHGWANTMYVLRDKWLKQGKGGRWTRLISRLITAFPSGNLPTSPPVGSPAPNTVSLAEKFAAVDVPSPQRPVEPIYGDEPWTRDDAAYWIPVAASELKGEEEFQVELLRNSSLSDLGDPQALHRRRSEVFAWMDDVGSPVTPPSSTAPPSLLPAYRAAEREAWEERFLEQVESETALATIIESMPVAQLKGHLFTMMNERRRSSLVLSRCTFCLASLQGLSVQEWRAHHELHAESANEMCPFCGMPWVGWSSDLRAAHIFYHDVDVGAHYLQRRRSSGLSSGFGALAAIPRTKRKSSTKRGESTAKAGSRRPSKVHFSPVTVEKRIAYNDAADEDREMDADASSAASNSPKRANLRTHTKPAVKPRKPSLTLTRPTSTTRSAARRAAEDEDLSWDPRRYSASSSEHMPSPLLRRRVVIPSDHPDAKWDPRRVSKSSSESLEYNTGSRRVRKTRRNAKKARGEALERRSSAPADSGKHRASEEEEEYANDDPARSAWSYELVPIFAKRGKAQNSILRNGVLSSVSSASSAATTKRNRVAGSKKQPAKRQKTPITHQALNSLPSVATHKGVHRDSTVSNVSPASDVRRATATEWPDEELIKRLTTRKKSTPSRLPQSSTISPTLALKKRKAATLDSTISQSPAATVPTKRRRMSETLSKGRKRNFSSGSDYIAFVDDNLLEDHTSDVLMGNPFAAVPRKQKGKTGRSKAKSKEPAPSSNYLPSKKRDPIAKKVPAAVETAFNTQLNATATDLKARRASKRTTILGQPHVEPLPVAPARRYSQSRSYSTASALGLASPSIEDILHPPTSASSSAISPKQTISKRSKAAPRTPSTSSANGTPDHNRGRRSSAPTPSPSLASRSTILSATTVRTKPTGTKSKAPPRRLDMAAANRKASYDVPSSEVRALVPPNTPADGLGKERRSSSKSTTGSVSEVPTLDARKLSVKIGTVKTTRGGLVRELPVGVEKSVAGKAKLRGRSVSKRKEKEKDGTAAPEPVVTKKVVKKGVKLARSAGVRKAAGKTKAATRRKSEVDRLMEDSASQERGLVAGKPGGKRADHAGGKGKVTKQK